MNLAHADSRLLLVMPSGCFGGAERVAYNLMRGISAYECTLLTQAVVADAFRPLGASIQLFDDFGCTKPYDLTPFNALRYAAAIRKVCRQVRPQRVLAMMHNGTFFCSIARWLLGMDGILIGSIHGNITAYFTSEGRKPGWWERQVIRISLAIPDGIITPSQGVADDLATHYSAPINRLKAIPNGIDPEPICELASLPIDGPVKDRPWIASACRLAPQKDFLTLLRAFASVRRMTEARLILIGDGELRTVVENMVEDLGLRDDVLMTGFQENPYRYLGKADISVLSSFYEGSPVAIIEAFVLGIPQVVTDCPSGPSELIEEGVNGFLVQPGDAAAMADRMLRLISDPLLQQTMGAAARRRSDQYGLSAMIHRYERYLQWPGVEHAIAD